MTDEQREAARERWRRWYDKNKGYHVHRTSNKASYARVCDNEDCKKAFVAHNIDARYCSATCRKMAWKKRSNNPSLITAARVRAEDGLDKPARPPCNCKQYSRCTRCRYAERDLAAKENRVPVYMQAALAAAGMGD